jgi:GABA(A) receptor-associated protein
MKIMKTIMNINIKKILLYNNINYNMTTTICNNTSTLSLEQRLSEASKIKKKYPDKIPVIINKSSMCNNLDDIDRNKYLIPHDLCVGQLSHIVKKRLNIDSTTAIFLFCNNNILNSSNTINELHNLYKNADGFLYIEYTSENTFG